MKLTYNEIYNIYDKYIENIYHNNEKYFPVKIYFIMNKNFKKIKELRFMIDAARENLVKHYGEDQGDGSYVIPSDLLTEAQLEMDKLSNTSTEIDIDYISISEFEKIELTPAQYNAIEWMLVI